MPKYAEQYALKRKQSQPTGVWMWIVAFARKGKRYSKSFHDIQHGSTAKARKAALAWRDAKLREVLPMTMTEFADFKRSNNASGVVGVHFLTSPRQPQGYWQAKLKLAGKGVHKSFSVREHGYEPAFQMAVKARAIMIEQAQPRQYLKDSLAKRLAPKPL